MKITINRAELLSAAQRAAAIAPEDSPVEALRGTLLETNAATGALTLTATNLETALEQSLSCPTAEDDALVVDAKLLAGMLERLPGDTVELKRTPGVPVLSLRGGQTGYDVAIWERGSFPKLEIPFPEDTVKLSGIPSMARHTMFATAEDKDKPLMRCVNLMFTQKGLKGAGYNGRCMVPPRATTNPPAISTCFCPPAPWRSWRHCVRTRTNSMWASPERTWCSCGRALSSAPG